MKEEISINFESDFQAVVLAAGSGSRFSYLLGGKPKCLLPVCNRPLIQYSLELLFRHQIKDAIVIVLDNEEEQIRNAVSRLPVAKDMQLEYFPLPNEKDIGTAECLRWLSNRVKKDVLLLSSDLVTDLDLSQVIRIYRTRQPTMLMVLSSTRFAKEDSVPGNKLDPYRDEFDFVALDATDPGRLVMFEPDCLRTDVIPVKRSTLLNGCPKISMRSDLADSHLYLFPNSLLGYLDSQTRIHSFRLDLLPSLVRKQFRKPSQKSQKADSADLSADIASPGDIYQYVPLPVVDGQLEANNLTDFHYPDTAIQCAVVLLDEQPSKQYAIRVNTLLGYCRANRMMLASHSGRLVGTKMDKNSNIHNSVVSPTCTVGDGCTIENSVLGPYCTVGNGCTIRNSVLGPYCKLGDGCTILSSVLQAYVTVQNGVHLQSCVVAEYAHLGQQCSLEQCVVGPHCTVPAHAHIKNEIIVKEESLDFDN